MHSQEFNDSRKLRLFGKWTVQMILHCHDLNDFHHRICWSFKKKES